METIPSAIHPAERAVRVSGRGFGSLGGVMIIFSVIPGTLGLISLSSIASAVGRPFPIIFLIPLFFGLVIGLALWMLGTSVQKKPLTRDTVLYIRLALGLGILLLVEDALAMRLSLDTILHVIFMGYVVYGMVKIRQVAVDLQAKDPKRIVHLIFAGFAALILLYIIAGDILAK